jgi:adenylate kinase
VSELNLILIGPPGAGKGTQAERLRQDFDLPYLATGDMMRAAKKEDSDLGREIAKIMADGGLVSDDVVCRVLLAKVDEEGDDGFLLDGFPRTAGQADILDDALDKRGRSITAVLLIEADDDVVVDRISGRRMDDEGNVYHVSSLPDGVDEASLHQREDDKPDVVRKRLAVYHEQTEPLIERYEDAGVLQRFDGSQSPDEVYDHIRSTLRTLKLEQDV